MEDFNEKDFNCFYNFIGKTQFLYNLPYIIDKEKFKNYLNLEENYFTKVFGYDLEKQKESNVVSFWISKHKGYFDNEEEWNIHFHLWLDDWKEEKENCFNPTLSDKNGKTLKFKTQKETEDFLIDLLKEVVIKVDVKGYEHLNEMFLAEVNRIESIRQRMNISLHYINDPFNLQI